MKTRKRKRQEEKKRKKKIRQVAARGKEGEGKFIRKKKQDPQKKDQENGNWTEEKAMLDFLEREEKKGPRAIKAYRR